MTCSACSSYIEKNINKLDGVNIANVNLLANSMTVDYNETNISDREIVDAVVKAGYNASIHSIGNDKKETLSSSSIMVDDEIKNMKFRLIVSFIFLVPLFYIAMGHMLGFPLPMIFHGSKNSLTYGFTQFLLTLPIVYVNRKYFKVGFKTLAKGSPNMDSLIAIGSTAAILYGIFAIYKIGYGLGFGDYSMIEHYSMDLYFESAGTILTLITLGKYLETRSKGKTSEAITKLMDLAPKTATILKDGNEIEVPVEEVKVDDILIIKPGQSIPVDGIIIQGNSSIDESAITGESIPIEKNVGDKVITATINKSGSFNFRATKVGTDTTLAQIIQLVEDASSSKAPIAKLADKISGVFVPVVIGLAVIATIIWLLLGYEFEFALSIGISILVVSCPCALGLATPVAIMVGTGKGAENGILIKSAEALEIAHTVDTVVLDKTGTITEGKPKVTDIIPSSRISKEDLLQIAASIEKLSEHPLSEAIVNEGANNKLPLLGVTNFMAFIGEGIEGTIGDKTYIAGNLKLMNRKSINMDNFITISDNLSSSGKTSLYFAQEGSILGIIAVADLIKETSKKAIEAFDSMGINVVMLTGDNRITANAIKEQLGIKTVISEVMPQDKEIEVRKLQDAGRKVAMIGDGINDAPALARADVGIAIGAGTDVAIESADIVLMKSDLLDAAYAINLSSAVIKNIKQNLFWAFIYNIIGIPLAAGILYPLFGLKLNPMFAAAAMSLSSVSVVTNALRLKLFKSNNIKNNKEGEMIMKKTILIEGMSCGHCTGRVDKALNQIEGVTATVSLEEKSATVILDKDISDEILKNTIEDAGYEVKSIE